MALISFVLLGFACVFSSRADVQYTGVNLSGAEFGQQNLPGTFNTDYTYPNQTEVNYFQSKGMNIIRLPFRWERLQHTNNAALDPTELGRMNTFVSATTAKGVYVILDPHNFARYYPGPGNFQSTTNGLIGTTVPYADFSNFWNQVAAIYKTNDHVFFNLMNEPNTMRTTQWVAAANAAIVGIRAAGATNLILVPGNDWTGAWTWSQNYFGARNSQAMLNIVDSGNNYAYDVHQYLDSNGSGTTTNIVSPTIGLERLTNFTAWLKINNRKGFLGEFAVANSTIGSSTNLIGDEALTNMLGYVRTNSDVWLGWTWWAGGPWWGNYMFLLDPTNLGQTSQTDEPAMIVLLNFIPIPSPTLQVVTGNRFRFVAQTGFVYQSQTSSDLTPGSWTNYGSAITGAGQTVTVNTPVGSVAQAFYRVQVSHGP